MAAQMTLPKVQYNLASCQYNQDIDSQAQSLVALIGSVVSLVGATLDIPPYEAMNLENGLDGDGILDQYELSLLGAALCNSPALQAQLTANENKYIQLVTDVQTVAGVLLGSGSTPNVAVRLNQVVTILQGISSPPPELAAIITSIQSAADSCAGLLADLPAGVDMSLVNSLVTQLKTFKTAVGSLIGLSTEMQQTVLGLLSSSIMTQITDIRAQVVAVIDAVPTITPLVSTADAATLNAVAADAQSIVTALDRTIALTVPGGIPIYGVTGKTVDEPFSAAGDYDKDGVTNLATYEAIVGCGGGISEFVAGASGFNPYFCGRAGLPVAGLFGLAALASAMTVGGAFSIRRRK